MSALILLCIALGCWALIRAHRAGQQALNEQRRQLSRPIRFASSARERFDTVDAAFKDGRADRRAVEDAEQALWLEVAS